ncbi:hypothetical protein NECAME_13641 [Necator americanus]|uniref:Uncharacterized protein n=1 Tax=Necator americanus TaxID=51031 RepID=W2STF0_NECAM|nr:hypothetical protein NECAME_13641 [Necator americanus]ETN73034.1 hypothetical protein NECAME_13641 [Necator americanus]
MNFPVRKVKVVPPPRLLQLLELVRSQPLARSSCTTIISFLEIKLVLKLDSQARSPPKHIHQEIAGNEAISKGKYFQLHFEEV